MPKSRGKCHSGYCLPLGAWSANSCLRGGKASKVTNKSQIEGKWATKCDDREQTQMSAFVVDPMDAQKPWQVSLGLLLCLWALGQRIRASDAAKLAKSLTKAKSKEMGATKCDGREQTLMSAFVVDPMDAQKPWQVSLGLLLAFGRLVSEFVPQMWQS